MTAPDGKSYVFIAGLHRSGTTAFSELLNAHSEMIVLNERFYNIVDQGPIEALTPALFAPERLLFPTPEETHNHVWNNEGPFHRHLQAKYPTARILGDKVPHIFNFTEQVFDAFPDSKMIFMTRNVFDAAASWQKRLEDAGDDVWVSDHAAAVRFWNDAHRIMLEKVAAHPGRIAVVSYERLFCYAPRYLDAILRFIGATPGDQTIFSWYRKATREWMARYSAPRALTDDQRAHVAAHAEFGLHRVLVDQADVG